MHRVLVLVSGGGTNLQAIIDAVAAGTVQNTELVGVISNNPGVFALERAAKAGIRTRVILRKDYPDTAAYSAAMLDAFRAEQADLIVQAGFMTILDETICRAYPNKMMNVHPALIPSFCGKGYYGLKVHEEALKKGVKLTGATVHFVTEVCDGGPIILQKAVEVQENDTPEILQKRVMEQAEWKILPQAVALFCDDKLEVRDGRVHIKN